MAGCWQQRDAGWPPQGTAEPLSLVGGASGRTYLRKDSKMLKEKGSVKWQLTRCSMVELAMPEGGLQTMEDSIQKHQKGGHKHEGRSSGSVRNKEWQETLLCPRPQPPAPHVTSPKVLSMTCGNNKVGEVPAVNLIVATGGGKVFVLSV